MRNEKQQKTETDNNTLDKEISNGQKRPSTTNNLKPLTHLQKYTENTEIRKLIFKR